MKAYERLVAGAIGVALMALIFAPIHSGAATAIPIRDINYRPLQPYYATASAAWNAGSFLEDFSFPAVPAGKILVVEYVNVKINMPPGQKPYRTALYPGFLSSHAYYIPTAFQAASYGGGFDQWLGSEQVKFYVPAGQMLNGQVYRDSIAGSSPSAIEVNVTGYLVDAP